MKRRETTEQCLLQETQLILNGNMMSFIRKHAAVHHKQLLKATKSATVWEITVIDVFRKLCGSTQVFQIIYYQKIY